MLLRSRQMDVKLITTTYGKAEYRAKIIAKMLMVAGRTDIPIGLGAGGQGGQGRQEPWIRGFKLADYPGKVYPDGAGAIIQTIRASPRPVTVISIGPEETLAAALKRDPSIARLANYAGMQGSIYKGYNGGPVSAEWNVRADPAAARIVLSAPWRHAWITPLDTCGLVNLTGPRFAQLRDSQDPLVHALMENYCVWAHKKKISDLQASSTLYDTAAVYLANPRARRLMKMERLPIVVDDKGFTRVKPGGAMLDAAVAWTDLDAYRDLLVRRILGKR